MQTAPTLLKLFVPLALGAAVWRTHGGEAPPPARFIGAEIRLVDEVVLRGSTSDDGDEDVDEVWDYQRDGSLTYETGPGSAALGVAPGAETFTLSSAPRPEGKGQSRPAQIVVDVPYGGTVATADLRLVRVPGSPEPGRWRVHVDELERLFVYRSLSRREAADLKHPKRTK